MTYYPSAFKSSFIFRINFQTFFDSIGFFLVVLLLCLIPFHFFLYDKVIYYREFISMLFILLCLGKIRGFDDRVLNNFINFRNPLFILLVFPVILLLWSVIIPVRILYNIDVTQSSLHLTTISTTLYVIRNASLYLPMVFYFYLRGLTCKELRNLSLIIVLMAPLSVLAFLYHYDIATISTLGKLATIYGAGLQYNSYVPYLTFAILCALFLVNQSDNHPIVILVSLLILVILITYLIFSTSRQGLLFVSICIFIFFMMNHEISILKKVQLLLMWFIFVGCFYQLILHDSIIQYANFCTNKVTSLANIYSHKASRLSIMLHGIKILRVHEWLVGAGLTSVITSGPHSDYIRWIQRLGILGAALGFYPFIVTFFSALNRANVIGHVKNAHSIFMFLAIFFTLYQSIFGYPREDAYQAPFCYLGLAIWFGYNSKYPRSL